MKRPQTYGCGKCTTVNLNCTVLRAVRETMGFCWAVRVSILPTTTSIQLLGTVRLWGYNPPIRERLPDPASSMSNHHFPAITENMLLRHLKLEDESHPTTSRLVYKSRGKSTIYAEPHVQVADFIEKLRTSRLNIIMPS